MQALVTKQLVVARDVKRVAANRLAESTSHLRGHQTPWKPSQSIQPELPWSHSHLSVRNTQSILHARDQQPVKALCRDKAQPASLHGAVYGQQAFYTSLSIYF